MLEPRELSAPDAAIGEAVRPHFVLMARQWAGCCLLSLVTFCPASASGMDLVYS